MKAASAQVGAPAAGGALLLPLLHLAHTAATLPAPTPCCLLYSATVP